MTTSYSEFLAQKTQLGGHHGFEPVWMHPGLFDFQKHLTDWALMKGRAAIFADCGLGKTPMQLVWAENISRKTNGRVLILTPLAVAYQTVREGEKFGIECHLSRDGRYPASAKIVVTNYEKLHLFSPSDFVGAVGDESGGIKNFDGERTAAVIEFMRTLKYRLLCTATAAPNDYIELGTHSEALGEMGYMDMLGRFFKANNGSLHPFRGGHPRAIHGDKWRFRGHAEKDFWRWICSWARAARKPSDLGFGDGDFVLPPLILTEHAVQARFARPDRLFDTIAFTLEEQREERRRTLPERCEKVAELLSATGKPAIAWCHLNPEGDLITKLIPDAVQVSGADSDDRKEEVLTAFVRGEVRVLVSKPTVAGFGLNLQHCAHMTFFPSHSYEQMYQAVRRCYRFGQKSPVIVDMVTSEGEAGVLANLQRKAEQADAMFARLVEHMNNELKIEKKNLLGKSMEVPAWMK